MHGASFFSVITNTLIPAQPRELENELNHNRSSILWFPSCRLAPNLYLWVPNAMLPSGIEVLSAWGFKYKSNIVWHKIRKDGGSDGRGVGFYFRNVTELLLFGVRGKNARTEAAGRRQVNYIKSRKREHSRKPEEQYPLIESCSKGPYLELFARHPREGWTSWGDELEQ